MAPVIRHFKRHLKYTVNPKADKKLDEATKPPWLSKPGARLLVMLLLTVFSAILLLSPITNVGGLVLASSWVWYALAAMKYGTILKQGGSVVEKTEDPFSFWLYCGFFLLFGIGMFLMAILFWLDVIK